MNQVKLFSGDTQFVPKKMYCCNSIKYCGEILMNQGKFFRVTFSLFRKKYIATSQSKILWNTYVKIPAFEKLNDPTSNAGKI